MNQLVQQRDADEKDVLVPFGLAQAMTILEFSDDAGMNVDLVGIDRGVEQADCTSEFLDRNMRLIALSQRALERRPIDLAVFCKCGNDRSDVDGGRQTESHIFCEFWKSRLIGPRHDHEFVS